MEPQAIFLNPFTICSSCKWKFVIRPLVYEERNGSYPFANGPNRRAHLCLFHTQTTVWLFEVYLAVKDLLGYCTSRVGGGFHVCEVPTTPEY